MDQVTIDYYCFNHGKLLPQKMIMSKTVFQVSSVHFLSSFQHNACSGRVFNIFQGAGSAKSSELNSGITLLAVTCSLRGM